MFSFRRDKMGFFAGIALMAIAVGTLVSTLVLVIVGLAQGDWTLYLLPVKWILGSAWVLSIATVLTRVHVFGWQLRRAQTQAEASSPSEESRPERSGNGESAGTSGPGVAAEQSDRPPHS